MNKISAVVFLIGWQCCAFAVMPTNHFNEVTEVLRPSFSAGVSSLSTILANPRHAYMRTRISTLGKGSKKLLYGVVGEDIINNVFLSKNDWVRPISPRLGRQGIDQIQMRINRATGLPRSNGILLVGETKFNKAQLNAYGQDGPQMSHNWINKRLYSGSRRVEGIGLRYQKIASGDVIIQKRPIYGAKREMVVYLENGREIYFWQNKSTESWKCDCMPNELTKAKQRARTYGDFLEKSALNSNYRARLYRVVPQGDDVVIEVSKLTSSGEVFADDVERFVCKGLLKKKTSDAVSRELATYLKKIFPNNFSETERLEFANELTYRHLLKPYGKFYIAGRIVAGSALAASVGAALDVGLQCLLNPIGEINYKQTGIAAGSIAVGSLVGQGVQAGLTAGGFSSTIAKGGGALSSIAVVSVLIPYAEWYWGSTDIEMANRSAFANVIGGGLGWVASGMVGSAVTSAFAGTAVAATATTTASVTTGAAVGSSAATAAAGSGMATFLSAAAATGAGIIVAAAGTAAIMIAFEVADKKAEYNRLTRLSELLLDEEGLERIMNNMYNSQLPKEK